MGILFAISDTILLWDSRKRKEPYQLLPTPSDTLDKGVTMLTQEFLKKLFYYDPKTGFFTRLIEQGKRGRVGDIAGSPNNFGHIQIKINRVLYKAHRLAWLYVYGKWPKNSIDHINGVPSDNRIINLRDVSHMHNMQNIRRLNKTNTSGFMGVHWYKQQHKWGASITANYKRIFLGLFETPEQAYNKYIEAKRKYHAGCTI
jgi:hypothetical protein